MQQPEMASPAVVFGAWMQQQQQQMLQASCCFCCQVPFLASVCSHWQIGGHRSASTVLVFVGSLPDSGSSCTVHGLSAVTRMQDAAEVAPWCLLFFCESNKYKDLALYRNFDADWSSTQLLQHF
jgi:hypothetical protein